MPASRASRVNPKLTKLVRRLADQVEAQVEREAIDADLPKTVTTAAERGKVTVDVTDEARIVATLEGLADELLSVAARRQEQAVEDGLSRRAAALPIAGLSGRRWQGIAARLKPKT